MRATLLIFGAVGAGWWFTRRRRHARGREPLDGRVVAITGGSRGLGLALAEEFARLGCRLAICARDPEELERARGRLDALGAEVLTHVADVGERDQVRAFIEATNARFGGIDILVNNAGIISAGPLGVHHEADFKQAMDVMFWGVYWPTMAVLDGMRERGYGRIVNITSLGGKVAVPHLLPYSSAKFAAVGLSEGLRHELLGSAVYVTTVVPGLMRTGSYLNAEFAGRPKQEFGWFSVLGNLPFTSTDGGKAARRIVRAAREGEAEVTIGLPARLASRLQGLAPGTMAMVIGAVNLALPGDPGEGERERARGWQSETLVSQSFPTTLGRRAARLFGQYPLKGRQAGEPDRTPGATHLGAG